jgi:UDP-glucose 4-epimerase
MQTLMVTGAGGYIGSNTVDVLLAAGYRVVAVDNFSQGFKQPLELLQSKYGADNLPIYTCDLTHDGAADVMEKEPQIEGILHFAALLDVGESMLVPEKYFSNNVIGTQKLLHSAIDHKIKRFIFSSSCTVYGDIKSLPVSESEPLKEVSSAYGQTKKMCEELLMWYDRLDKMKYMSLRYFNVCGASDDGTLGDAKIETFGLMQNAVKGALGIRPFEFNYQPVDTPDGSPVRDFINVVDLARGHVAAFKHLEESDKSNVFNLGSGQGVSVLEIVNMVKKVLGADFPTSPAQSRRTGEIPQIYANADRARDELGWKATHTIEQSIQALAAFYRAHPKGWE